jgi:hypothetical protein
MRLALRPGLPIRLPEALATNGKTIGRSSGPSLRSKFGCDEMCPPRLASARIITAYTKDRGGRLVSMRK